MTPQEAAEQYALKFKTQASSEGLDNVKDDFLAGQQWQAKQDHHAWIKSSDQLPPYNKGVLVFIPEEDNHITAGMYDISNKWVLLDEYRQPQSQVTYWREMPSEPEDKTYEKSFIHTDELETMSGIIRSLNKEVFDGDQALFSALKEIAELHAKLHEMSEYITKVQSKNDDLEFANSELHAKVKELENKPNNFM